MPFVSQVKTGKFLPLDLETPCVVGYTWYRAGGMVCTADLLTFDLESRTQPLILVWAKRTEPRVHFNQEHLE